jgi:hypothetical protein
MEKAKLTPEQKTAVNDLIIIIFATLAPLIIYIFFGNQLMAYARNESRNIFLRYIPVLLTQYGLAGFGISIVMTVRKETFKQYGITVKNSIKAIIGSVIVSIPTILFLFFTNQIDGYLPFQGMFLTRTLLQQTIPLNILLYISVCIVWGFFEGMVYVIASDKINKRYSNKNNRLNKGAIVCGILCILIHGMIGLDIETIMEAITTFILIYGMIIIKEKTQNAWGCIFIFVFIWNAF